MFYCYEWSLWIVKRHAAKNPLKEMLFWRLSSSSSILVMSFIVRDAINSQINTILYIPGTSSSGLELNDYDDVRYFLCFPTSTINQTLSTLPALARCYPHNDPPKCCSGDDDWSWRHPGGGVASLGEINTCDASSTLTLKSGRPTNPQDSQLMNSFYRHFHTFPLSLENFD